MTFNELNTVGHFIIYQLIGVNLKNIQANASNEGRYHW